jgi:hypothetical protein
LSFDLGPRAEAPRPRRARAPQPPAAAYVRAVVSGAQR